ncbi:MAG TPA: DUF1080 domain-containing protein, partial [Blastocatellia bacterium]|nr:DUF1080 domain-containing protein [Blastocatellia bacterium]
MKNRMLQLALVLCLSAFASMTFAQTPGFADAVLGRWDITVQGADGVSYPSWLEVRLRKENELMASFVGRFGSMRYASKAEYANGQLTVVIPAQYEAAPKELVFTGKLNGEQLTGTVGDEKGNPIPWTGKRAPALTPAKTVAWGAPIQLFNGKDLSGWKLRNNAHPNCWSVENGVMTNKTPCADIISDQKFTDFKAHVEFQVVPNGNSGVYLRGRYETQISDGFNQVLDSLRMGAVYGWLKPSVNAAKKPGEWQALDITLVGRKVTVVFNGQTIIDNETIPGITGGALDSNEAAPGPIMLQGDHTKVMYRKVEIT